MADFAVDHFEEAFALGDGGDEKFAVAAAEGAAGEEGEEIDDILADIFAAGEQTEVGIKLGGFGIIVAGGDVGIAAHAAAGAGGVEAGGAGASAVIFATDDEGGFSVSLQAQDAIDDVGAGVFQGLGPLDVAFFVEAGFELHQDGDLLAGLRGEGEGGDEGGIAAGAVEGHFDGEDFGVFDGREDEAFDGGIEGFIRVMDEDIIVADDGEDVGGGIGEGGVGVGLPGGEAQGGGAGDIGIGDGHQIHHAKGFGQFVNAFGPDFEAVDEILPHLGGHVRGNLDADGIGEAAGAEFLLYGFEEIFGILGVGFHFRIARDAERLMLQNFHAGEEQIQAAGDQTFQGDEDNLVGFRKSEPAREQLRDLDAGEEMFALAGLAQEDADGDGKVGDEGKRVAGVDRQGREHGEDLPLKIIVGAGALVGA